MDIPTKLEFAVDMSCSSCAKSIEKVLADNSNIQNPTVNFNSKQVIVETNLSAGEVQSVIETTGSLAALVGIGSTLTKEHLGAAVADIHTGKVKGVIRLLQLSNDLCLVDGAVDGLSPGQHGLNIHSFGDLTKGCDSCGDHFNPYGKLHGGLNDDIRHVGDLGNIVANEDGKSKFRFTDKLLKVYDVIGRSIVIHEKEDDSGKGNDTSSKIDGNSGKGIACAIIARSAGLFQNPKRFCACDGIPIWEERNVPVAGEGRQTQATL